SAFAARELSSTPYRFITGAGYPVRAPTMPVTRQCSGRFAKELTDDPAGSNVADRICVFGKSSCKMLTQAIAGADGTTLGVVTVSVVDALPPESLAVTV